MIPSSISAVPAARLRHSLVGRLAGHKDVSGAELCGHGYSLWRRWSVILVGLVALSGCASPYIYTVPAQSEPIGNKFRMTQISLVDGGAVITFILRPENNGGNLKICGLYLMAVDEKAQDIVNVGIQSQSSTIELGATKDTQGVMFAPSFLRGYSVEKNSPVATIKIPPSNPLQLSSDMASAKIFEYSAGCATTEEKWQDVFSQGQIKVHLAKIVYNNTVSYAPATRR